MDNREEESNVSTVDFAPDSSIEKTREVEPDVNLAAPEALSDDLLVTNRMPRVVAQKAGPAPLPPSPGAKDVEGWFDSQPTYTDPKPKLRRSALEHTGVDSLLRTSVAAARGQTSHSRGLLLLLAAASMAVGMVVGALLFGKLTTHQAADDDAQECVCPPPGATTP